MRSSENKKRWARIQPIASSICNARITKSLAGMTVVMLANAVPKPVACF